MIRVEGLVRTAGGRRVVDGVSFEAAPGEITGVLGPNGAGKTTTLRVLAGYRRPHAGRVLVAGRDVAIHSREIRRRLGYLPERVPGGPVRVESFLRFVARAKEIPARETERRIDRGLDEVGLAGFRRRVLGRLSKGERARAGLAAALLGDPEVLLLDEPTSGLDPGQRIRVRDLIRRQRERRTVLLSTHLLFEAESTCDRVVVLSRGRVVASGPPDRLGGDPAAGGLLEVELEAPPREGLEALRRVPGVAAIDELDGRESEGAGRRVLITPEPGRDVRAALAAAIVGGGGRLVGLRTRSASLEEIFLRVVAGAGEGGEGER
jgi:ABC-2 type transport system ATP-binding protein